MVKNFTVTPWEVSGNVDYDKLGYLIENYDNLPDVFLWGKSNLFKYVYKEYFEEALKNPGFKPLLRLDHKTYSDRFGVVCDYFAGMYRERNDSWYTSIWSNKNCRTFGEFAQAFNLPTPALIPFAPGGNYILTRERVHK